MTDSRKSKTLRAAGWVALNAAYCILLWRALAGSNGAQNVVVFFTWLTGVNTFCSWRSAELQGKLRAKGRSVPKPIANLFAAVVLAVLVWHGWWWTAAGWFIGMIGECGIYDIEKTEKKQ